MSNFYIYNGNIYSEDELRHTEKGYEKPGHKYIKREWKNGEWRYYYELASKTGKGLKDAFSSKDEKTKLKNAQEHYRRRFVSRRIENDKLAKASNDLESYSKKNTLKRAYKKLLGQNTSAIDANTKVKGYKVAKAQKKVAHENELVSRSKSNLDKKEAEYKRAKTITGKTSDAGKVLKSSGKELVSHLVAKRKKKKQASATTSLSRPRGIQKTVAKGTATVKRRGSGLGTGQVGSGSRK